MLRIRFVAAIAAVLFVAMSEAVVRPGTCPDPRVMRIACDGTRAVEGQGCTTDDQCSAGRKCCDSPCGWKECFVAGSALPPPIYDYDGCPPPTKELCQIDRPQSCNSTTKCGFGEKCCPVSCNGMQCMPAGQKEGQCEDPKRELADCMFDAWENSKAECAYDYQCDGTLKCCEQTCVKPLCKAPIPVKPGQCPMHIMGCPSDQFPDTITNDCEHDGQCSGSMKCCSTPCSGMKCQLPQGEPDSPKAGECKPVNWAAISCLPMDEEMARVECRADNQCEGTAKCCENPCTEKRCLLPAECPNFDPHRTCLIANPIECDPGTKNAYGRTCCKYECGGARYEPELCPGVNPNIRCIRQNDQACTSSDACGPDEICCGYECGGTRCVPRDIPAHSDSCPDYTGIKPKCPAVVPTNECENDQQCYAGKKCCKKICGGLGCIDSVKEVRPGKCPDYSNVKPYCPAVVPTDDCANDGECPTGQKCCTKICGGLGCLDIVKDNYVSTTVAPVCPVFDSSVVCKKRQPYTCNIGASCSNGGQCCGIECSGSSCLTGLCPAPENKQCFAPESRECESSSTCATGTLCCGIHCGGTRCLKPVGSSYTVDGGNPTDIKEVKGSPAPICPKPDKTRKCPDSLRSRACTSDAQCGNKKCCDTGCDVDVCQTPVRPGTCPNPVVRCRAPTPSDKSNQCGTDMSCPGSQKCCPSPCPGFGASCVDPAV